MICPTVGTRYMLTKKNAWDQIDLGTVWRLYWAIVARGQDSRRERDEMTNMSSQGHPYVQKAAAFAILYGNPSARLAFDA